MKKKIVYALCTLLLLAVFTITPATAYYSDSKTSTPDVMYLTSENNPVDPKQIEEIREDIKNGNVMTAKLKTDQAVIEGVDFTLVRQFSFEDVRELKSQNFSVTENDVSIEARAWDNDGNESGSYTITLYRDELIDKKIGTAAYRYSPEKRTYYNIWFDVGPGNYYFVLQCSDNYLDGDGRFLQRL